MDATIVAEAIKLGLNPKQFEDQDNLEVAITIRKIALETEEE